MRALAVGAPPGPRLLGQHIDLLWAAGRGGVGRLQAYPLWWGREGWAWAMPVDSHRRVLD